MIYLEVFYYYFFILYTVVVCGFYVLIPILSCHIVISIGRMQSTSNPMDVHLLLSQSIIILLLWFYIRSSGCVLRVDEEGMKNEHNSKINA